MTMEWSMRRDTVGRRALAALGVLLAFAASPCGRAEGGVNVWTSHGPDGGDVSVLAVGPGNPTRLLVGSIAGAPTPVGGIWASTDAAASWHQGAALGEGDGVVALAFVPGNPMVAFAATYRTGIMRSQDGGDHWTSVSTVLATAIAVSAGRPTTIYAVVDEAILKSEDGAVTWRSVSSGLPTGTLVESVAVQPDSELTVYAGTVGSGVFRSADGGATWAAASAGLPNTSSDHVGDLTFDFHTPPRLLAVVWDTSTYETGLYRSTDGGASWVAILPPSGFSSLFLGPGDPALIYLLGYNTVFKSTDDGATWTAVAVELPINVEIAALALDPNDTGVIYAGITGGAGVLKSVDAGMTWTASDRGLSNTSVWALALDPGPNATLYAPGNWNGLLSSTDHGVSWTSLGNIGTDGPTTILVDPSDPNTLYAGSFNGPLKSYDGGRSWVRINHGFDSLVKGVGPLAIDPSSPLTLYAGSGRLDYSGTLIGNPLYKTTNGGAAWEALSSLAPGAAFSVSALAVDPQRPATVYASGPGLWRTTNGGRSWAALVTSAFGFLSDIAIDPRGPDTIYCAHSSIDPGRGAVYKTVDGGSTWTGSNPGNGAMTLVLDPAKVSTLYVGGSGGVSMSLDGGATWALINGGMPDVDVTRLAIDRTGTRLYAATDGGGVFDLEISTATPEIAIVPDPVTIAAGTGTVLTATLDPAQLTETQLAASSSNPEVASVPDVVRLPAGDTSVSFTAAGAAAGGTTAISVRLARQPGWGLGDGNHHGRDQGRARPPETPARDDTVRTRVATQE